MDTDMKFMAAPPRHQDTVMHTPTATSATNHVASPAAGLRQHQLSDHAEIDAVSNMAGKDPRSIPRPVAGQNPPYPHRTTVDGDSMYRAW